MKVVILCGGKGTRLREETELKPKPMVLIGGKPILWHIMKIYGHHGLGEFVLCLGYKGHVIKDFFINYQARTRDVTVDLGAKGGVNFHTSADGGEDWQVTLADTGEETLTGSRLHKVRRYLGDETFCLTYGDGLGDVDINGLLEFHKSHGKLVTVTGVRPPGRFGEMDIKGTEVVSFDEKPETGSGTINGGFFVMEPAFVDRYFEDRDDLSLEHDALRAAAADGEVMVWQHEGFWQPMDTYREWRIFEDMWNDGQARWKVW